MQAKLQQGLGEDGALLIATDLRQTLAGWFAHLAGERQSSPHTLAAYERDLRQFLHWLKEAQARPPALADLASLDAKRLRAFMAARRRAGLSSRSLARTMSALRAYFRWLEAEDVDHNRAILQIALPKVPHGIPKPLTVAKAAAVVDGAARGERELAGGARYSRAVATLLLAACAFPKRSGCGAVRRHCLAATSCALRARAARSGWSPYSQSPSTPSATISISVLIGSPRMHRCSSVPKAARSGPASCSC